MRLARPRTEAHVLVEHFADLDPIEVGMLMEPGERRIFVADGTDAVLIDLSPGGRQRFDPAVGEIVVQ